MNDDLLGYYQDELSFLRKLSGEFARNNKKIAGRLLLDDAGQSEDPHVERMIESFAFLASRIHLKLNDEFPEITESLLNVLYPHYLAPIPSMSIAQFTLDSAQGKLTAGHPIPAATKLYSKIEGKDCRFRTSYPVTLWPVEVASAALEAPAPPDAQRRWQEAVLRLTVRCLNNTKFSTLRVGETEATSKPFESLRFYLNGEAALVYALYEMIFNNVDARKGVELRASGGGGRAAGATARPGAPAHITLGRARIRPVGFEADEGMLPYTPRSFHAYRLLTEFFAFPEKFLFFDITGLERAAHAEGFDDQLDILIHLRDVEQPRGVVDAETFQLGCTPIINLFNKTTEPIQLLSRRHEYEVVPDVYRRESTEVYSIESVTSVDPATGAEREFQPFYSYRHAGDAEDEGAFWYAARRESQRHAGTDLFLTLVDLNFKPNIPEGVKTLVVHTVCTNRDLPVDLPFGGQARAFTVEEITTLSQVRCLKRPTPTIQPQLRRGAQWRLISHLSLNHLSLAESGDPDSGAALREILMLYKFINSSATQRQITGIERVSSRRVVRQIGSRIGSGFVRGLETTVEFDQSHYVGSGVFLFASVLERFLGLYASVNSFNQLVAKVKQREGVLKAWPPRAGEQPLL